MKVTAKYFYGEIIYITKAIGRLGLTSNLIEAAMQQNLDEMKEVLKAFEAHHPELWQRMSNFYKDYDDEACPIIFGTEKSKEKYYQFHLTNIRPLDLICLIAISNGVIDEEDMFEEKETFQKMLIDKGYNKFAYYSVHDTANTLEDLLKVFKKK